MYNITINGELDYYDTVDNVITKYTEATSDISDKKLINRKDRKGSGEVIISNIRILDPFTKNSTDRIIPMQEDSRVGAKPGQQSVRGTKQALPFR